MDELWDTLQPMGPHERRQWLKESCGITLGDARRDKKTGYPVEVYRDGARIGEIIRRGRKVFLRMEGIGNLFPEERCDTDAIEILEHEWQPHLMFEPDKEHDQVNIRIFWFLANWARAVGAPSDRERV